MRGRKPTPTKLKILRGNPGHRPLNDDEPKARPAVPSCPKLLVGEAKKEWRRITKLLGELGLVTHLDRAALTQYCQLWARWVQAEEGVSKLGLLVAKVAPPADAQGDDPAQDLVEWVPNPLLRIAEATLKQLRAVQVEFGLTPSSRSRVKGQGSGSTGDALGDFLSGEAEEAS